MGLGKPNDEQNPPVPLQGHDECTFASRESGAADCCQNFPSHNTSADISFQGVYLSNSPWENMHATHQSYPHDPRTANHLMTDIMGLNTFQSLSIDPNLSNLGGSMRNGDVFSGGFQNTQANVNFMRAGSNAAGGYQMNVLGGEVEGSKINWSQIRGSSLDLGCGTSMSYQNTSFLETGFRDDVKVNAFHPRQVDGSFLTLGIGGNPEATAKSTFGAQEAASKLVEAVGSQSSSSQIQHATSLSSFQSFPGCFPSTLSKLGGWTSSNSDDGGMQGANVGMSSNPYLSPQMPETLKQYDFFENNAKNSGFVDKSVGRHSALESYNCFQGGPSPSSLPFNTGFADKSLGRHSAVESYKSFQGGPSPSSLPFNSSYTCLPHPGYTKQSELASETCKPTWLSTQPTRDLQWNSHSVSPGNVSSSFGSHYNRLRDSSVPQDYLGISILPSKGSATQAVESSHRCINVQPDGQLSSAYKVNSALPFGSSNNPKKTSLLIAEGSANKPATFPTFPRRLGVQIDDAAVTQSASGSVLPMNMGVQTRSNEHQSQNSGPVQLTKNLLGPPISGHRQGRSTAQYNFPRSSLSTGQPQRGVPAQFPKDHTRVYHKSGQVLPNAKVGRQSHVKGVVDQPSLKRRANETPLVPSWGQRKRFITTGPHSATGIPAIPPPTPTSPCIKWTGFESPPQPSGYRCMLCKRDLSFTPEGPVYQPTIPPPVAVLPCGHTCHDQCLQNITPEDQSKDPPCIPCAIGEK